MTRKFKECHTVARLHDDTDAVAVKRNDTFGLALHHDRAMDIAALPADLLCELCAFLGPKETYTLINTGKVVLSALESLAWWDIELRQDPKFAAILDLVSPLQGLAAYRYSHRIVNRFTLKATGREAFQIDVFCRMRPAQRKPSKSIYAVSSTIVCLHGASPPMQCELSAPVLQPCAAQDAVWDAFGRDPHRRFILGENVCLMAYGQTGSGKTHSMFGTLSLAEPDKWGLVMRACAETLRFKSAVSASASSSLWMSLSISVMECYLGKMCKLGEAACGSLDQACSLLRSCAQRRVSASTAMNARSSRSHCIVTLHLMQQLRNGTAIRSKLYLVDLSGSERVVRSEALSTGGTLLREARSINLSLHSLSRVVNALESSPGGHIPYRDCELTWALKDVLGSAGGACVTALLLTCSSDEEDTAETISTLRFGMRAANVRALRLTKNGSKHGCSNISAVLSLVECAVQLSCVRGQLQQLKELWDECGSGRHDACCRCDACTARIRGECRTPEHIPQWPRLQRRLQELELRHSELEQAAASVAMAGGDAG